MQDILKDEALKSVKKVSLMDLIKILTVSTAYMGAIFVVGVLGILVITWIVPFDPATLQGLFIVVAVFAGVGMIDFGLLFHNKITPALLLLAILISPLFAVYKLLCSVDLMGYLDRDTMPSGVRNYVIPGRIMNDFSDII
ncbi:MAG: hypothetical protein WC455_21760 [Dehalococcoidia bacterium]|jgi:hypothetical protein